MTIHIDEPTYWASMELVEDMDEPMFIVCKCVAILDGIAVDITGSVICDAPEFCERLEKKALEKWKGKK